MKFLLVLACAVALTGTALAADHGPVFSYATPVNSEREISFDSGIFGRNGSRGTQFSTGSGFGYGVTPHITLNAVLPATFGSGSLLETRIVPGSEWSAGVSWRFQHSVTSVGKRIESTASLGLVVPGPQQDSGVLGTLHRAPGIAGSLATGMASRSQYAWVGGGYTRFAEASRSRRPDTLSWSAVYGYRPTGLRRGYDQWDYRGFAELTGEHTGGVRTDGFSLPDSRSTTVWLGPSVLAIHKNVAIEGGVQGPLIRDVSEVIYGRERVRFALNLSYLKYSSHTNSH
jgi:opacity protein-like surface antigen